MKKVKAVSKKTKTTTTKAVVEKILSNSLPAGVTMKSFSLFDLIDTPDSDASKLAEVSFPKIL